MKVVWLRGLCLVRCDNSLIWMVLWIIAKESTFSTLSICLPIYLSSIYLPTQVYAAVPLTNAAGITQEVLLAGFWRYLGKGRNLQVIRRQEWRNQVGSGYWAKANLYAMGGHSQKLNGRLTLGSVHYHSWAVPLSLDLSHLLYSNFRKQTGQVTNINSSPWNIKNCKSQNISPFKNANI